MKNRILLLLMALLCSLPVFADPNQDLGTIIPLNGIAGVNLTKEVKGVLPVANGGTGGATLTNHGVVVGQGTSGLAATSAGTAGQALVSGGASADPAFATLGVAGGGTGATTLTAHGVVVGEGTSAVAITSAGTSGQPLVSGGASADPAFGTIASDAISTGAVKRNFFTLKAAPGGGVACSDGTVYYQFQPVPRAGTIKAISYMTHVDPVSGTNTVKFLKNGASGNTLINAASISLNGKTADTMQTTTLTATGADLALAVGDNIYFEYSAGTQGAAAKDVTAVIEYEKTDY